MNPPKSSAFDDAVRKSSYFPALDGLRAVSVLLVLLSHVRQGWATSGSRGLFEPLHGALGVTVFFVLSGFLITLLALRELDEKGRVDLSLFYLRRAFRLFPLYYLLLAVYIILVLVIHLDPRRAAFLDALPFYLTYLQEIPHTYGHSTAPFEISWSLGIEEKFYLVWPIVAFVILRRPMRRIGVALMTVMLAIVGPILLGARPSVAFMVGCYGSIAMGCLLALLAHDVNFGARIEKLSQGWVPFVSVALVAVSEGSPIVVAVATFLAIPALLTRTGSVAKLLGTRHLAWLGRRSYGIYLVHQLALSAARIVVRQPVSNAADLEVAILGLLLTVPAVALLHRIVEQPLIDRGKALTRKYRSPSLASSPEDRHRVLNA